MQNSKLITLLRTLDKDEIKELEKLVESPYFSRGRDCAHLLKALKYFYPSFESPELTPAVLFKKMYPGKKYEEAKSDSLISTLSTELYKLCKDYLIQAELNGDNFQKDNLLLRQFRKRNLNKEYTKEYEKLCSGIENSSGDSGSIFLNKYLLNLVHGDYTRSTGNIKGLLDSLIAGSEGLTALALIRSFITAGSKHNAQTYNIHIGYSFTDTFLNSLRLEELLENMKMNNDPFYPYVAAYYMAYMKGKHPGNSVYYRRLKELMEKEGEKFAHSEKHVLYLVLISYLSERTGERRDDALKRELFEIYNTMYRLNIFKPSPRERLDPNIFITALGSAFQLDRHEWAEEFIYTASPDLSPEYREGMKDFALGQLYMRKGEYEKALEKIIHVKYVYNLQKLDVKAMQVKLHYELNNFEQALSVIDAAKHYIATTNEVSDTYKKLHLVMLKYTAELIKRKTNNNLKDIDMVIEKMKNENQLLSRGWLLKKYEDLKDGKTGSRIFT